MRLLAVSRTIKQEGVYKLLQDGDKQVHHFNKQVHHFNTFLALYIVPLHYLKCIRHYCK